MMACAFGHRDIVRLLLDGGADVRGVSKDGESAMKLAVEKHETEIVDMLQRQLAQTMASSPSSTTTPASPSSTSPPGGAATVPS
jgi:ankyrin repeat protein